MGLPATSLRIGERVLVRCDDGPFDLEYALFASDDVVLRGSAPVTVHEAGYLTTAQRALERLDELGVTPDLAESSAEALDVEVIASYARGGRSVRAAARILRAYELFEGGTYRATSQRYDGTWLDLRSLSSATRLQDAPLILQALHLAAALNEVPESTPVLLSTEGLTTGHRPGHRTYHRVAVANAAAMATALRVLKPNPRPLALDVFESERQIRENLVQRLRERATGGSTASVRAHVESIEQVLAGEVAPRRGPLADPTLVALDQQISSGNVEGVEEGIAEFERQHGPGQGARYVRARAALLRGKEPPRRVAESLTEIVEQSNGFHEADLLAARSWLAAGDDAHARFFARRLAEDPTAPDGVRLLALEILDATPKTSRSNAPPPIRPAPHLPADSEGAGFTPPRLPGASMPPYVSETPKPPPVDISGAAAQAPRPSAPRGRGPRFHAELVETLALPSGTSEDMLAQGAMPTTPPQARVWATRLSRELGRDYRLWYGTTLRIDALAVEAMQRHLLLRFLDPSSAEPEKPRAGEPLPRSVTLELRRHGALLSEILARSYSAEWVDVTPSEPGYWTMLVPPETRTWPIGRVHRFVALGHHERDLVAYFLEIDARARGERG